MRHEGGDDLDALLVAERELLDLLAGAVLEAEALEVVHDRGLGVRGRHAGQLAEVDELVEDLLLGIEAALLGHVADACAGLPPSSGARPSAPRRRGSRAAP